MFHLFIALCAHQPATDFDPERILWRELRSSRANELPTDEDIADMLVDIGEPLIDPAWRLLVTREIPAIHEGEEVQTLSRSQRAILLDCLSQLDADVIRSRIKPGTLQGADEDSRRAALHLLGTVGTHHDLNTMFELVGRDEDSTRSRKTLDALQAGLTSLFRQRPESMEEFARMQVDLGDELCLPAVFALGAAGDSYGAGALLKVFDRHSSLQVAALSQAGRLGASVDEVVRESLATRARDWLTSGDDTQSRTASVFLGQVRDEDSIPYLILALDSDSTGVRRNALQALRAISSLDYPDQASLWTLWYEQELDWYKSNAALIEHELSLANDARVAAALLDVSRRRLHREELSRLIRSSLEHRKPHLRALAYQALGSLGSPASIEILRSKLADEDEDARLAACSALRRITNGETECVAEATQQN